MIILIGFQRAFSPAKAEFAKQGIFREQISFPDNFC